MYETYNMAKRKQRRKEKSKKPMIDNTTKRLFMLAMKKVKFSKPVVNITLPKPHFGFEQQ